MKSRKVNLFYESDYDYRNVKGVDISSGFKQEILISRSDQRKGKEIWYSCSGLICVAHNG
jgi:predicted RNA-binding protein (virulence factor B family)